MRGCENLCGLGDNVAWEFRWKRGGEVAGGHPGEKMVKFDSIDWCIVVGNVRGVGVLRGPGDSKLPGCGKSSVFHSKFWTSEKFDTALDLLFI